MSGGHHVGPAVESDEALLRSLETLVSERGMSAAYFPGTAGLDDDGASCPALMVFDSGGAEVARVTVARRGRTFLVSLFKGESARLLPFRTASDAAGMICGYQSPAGPGMAPGG
ncbi:hypothetical protein [Acrocarpospora catenulata]|uniref:hypothetical protein n=1 Tax=Acrocarpospora catenulata TaxID=2836182 RepID=UPI001BDA6D91|nr:hypothetical protein [Acrocarpospora catenulata]